MAFLMDYESSVIVNVVINGDPSCQQLLCKGQIDFIFCKMVGPTHLIHSLTHCSALGLKGVKTLIMALALQADG